MADVTGPISTLPGSLHQVPEGVMCDSHDDRPATRRVQGETDSFGAEMDDMCEECYEAYKAQLSHPENRIRNCDWCSANNVETRPTRDFEEGSCGRLYYVCSPCYETYSANLAAELADEDEVFDPHGLLEGSDEDISYDEEDWLRDDEPTEIPPYPGDTDPYETARMEAAGWNDDRST